MKTIHKIAGFTALLITLSLSLFSFTPGKGGDVFEIYLNQQLVLQDHVYGNTGPKTITLQPANINDELNIKYLQCGKIGKGRTITLKDARDKVLKQWSFDNTSFIGNKMSCKVKDILALKKDAGNTLQLFYSSEELANGQLLAVIN